MPINEAKNMAVMANTRFMIALALLAGLSLGAFLLMTSKIDASSDTAYIVNLSGRQRFLSERIYYCVKESVEHSTVKQQPLNNPCRQEIQLFESSHETLAAYVGRTKFSPKIGRLIHTLYASDGPYSQQKIHFVNRLNQVLRSNSLHDLPSREERAQLFSYLDTAVSLFQLHGELSMNHLIQVEGYIFLSILMVLLGLALFVFQPTLQMLRKRHEMLLTEREQTEMYARNKSDFLASMSHEIRTPINGISGMIELMKMTPLNEEQVEFVHAMNTSTQTLLALINDILDFSKLESNRMSLELAPLSVREMMDSLVDILYQDAQKRGFEFMIRLSPDVPEALLGDQNRLQQIVLNLLSNAFKFTESGHVLLDISLLSVSTETSTVRFSVTDTGKGIAPEKLNIIFDKYIQEDLSTTRQYGGSGLGLSICKRLINQMGGDIFVESTLNSDSKNSDSKNSGSKFWFDVPLKNITPVTPETDDPPREKTLKVLIVDDYQPSCDNLREQITLMGYVALDAFDVPQALSRLQKAHDNFVPFDLVLTDFEMPEQNGEDLVRAIKNDPKLFHTPVVLMNGAHCTASHSEMKQSGFQGVLQKPLSPIVLTQLLMMLEQAKRSNLKQNVFYTPRILREGLSELQSSVAHHPELLMMRHDEGLKTLKASVLVVEDTPINQKVIQTLLSKLNVRAELVASGEAALEKIENNSYQLVLMDLHMPGLSGLETTEKIRLFASKKDVPIVALTADIDTHVRHECEQAQMNGFLEKPISLEQLEACLAQWSIEFESTVKL